jgi:ubiquinone/menaquinone biosynthesis C-methylase UbiE
MAKYDYADAKELQQASTIEEAVRSTVMNYFYHQLGWKTEKCEQRVEMELKRKIPKGLFDKKSRQRGWELQNARLVDVGAGQGAGVLEALHRGADAYGVEPGSEFAALARKRLREGGYDPERIHETGGETLPFPDASFDYVISLQVLEHVEDPRPLLEEMHRVLRPGGEAVVRCENYLAFHEQHYRVPWLPMLPKSIGSRYLKAMGRDPQFLKNYVYYTTYPQIWRLSQKVGLKNETYRNIVEKAKNIEGINSKAYQMAGNVLRFLPKQIRGRLALEWMHLKNLFSVGVSVHLTKPRGQ